MATSKIKDFQRDLTSVLTAHAFTLNALAEAVRTELVLPLCRKHRCTFLSGNGTYFFYRRGDDGFDARNAADCLEHIGKDGQNVMQLL